MGFKGLPSTFQRCSSTSSRPSKPWKVPDEIKLTNLIKHALIALYQALKHLPPDEPEDSKLNLKMEFNSIIPRLRSKLQQVAGINALKAFDEEHTKGQLQIVGGAGTAYTQNHFLGHCV